MQINVTHTKSGSLKVIEPDILYDSLDLEDFICGTISDFQECVYVLSYDSEGHKHVVIEHDTSIIDDLASGLFYRMCDDDLENEYDVNFFLIECETYDEAYSVAKTIKDVDSILTPTIKVKDADNALDEVLKSNIRIDYSPN